MNPLQNSYLSIEQAKDTYFKQPKQDKLQQADDGQTLSFEHILNRLSEEQNESRGVTFSKHANDRLQSRNINLDEEQLNRLNRGVKQAKEKSIQESLVMMDNIAFIVNVKNNTVITAMDQQTNDSNVFTNIDGAVIV